MAFLLHHFSIFSAGDNINQRELDGIGSVETVSNVLTTENFDSLPTIRDGLVTAVCNGTSLILFITHRLVWIASNLFVLENLQSRQSLLLLPNISFRACVS